MLGCIVPFTMCLPLIYILSEDAHDFELLIKDYEALSMINGCLPGGKEKMVKAQGFTRIVALIRKRRSIRP